MGEKNKKTAANLAPEFDIDGKFLVIRIPIKPRPSKSGKTTVLASTNGNMETDLEYKDQAIIVGVNAYVYNQE